MTAPSSKDDRNRGTCGEAHARSDRVAEPGAWTRRALLRAATRLALGAGSGASLGGVVGVFGVACAGDSDPCVAREGLSTSEASLRASFHYAPRSPHGEAKRCGRCVFFRAAEADESACGRCDILQGSVSASGHCDSYSPRGESGSQTGRPGAGASA